MARSEEGEIRDTVARVSRKRRIEDEGKEDGNDGLWQGREEADHAGRRTERQLNQVGYFHHLDDGGE